MSNWGKQLAAIAQLAEREGRYGERAYVFVLRALDRAVKRLPERRHLSGRELLDAIRDLATDLYGPTAPLVLEHWGIRTTLDFGHIVFSLVDAGVLTKTEEDSLEDFRDVFDFTEEFVRRYPWGSGAAGA
jgi:uncharacterized repeat protein (TIGR04138 family)